MQCRIPSLICWGVNAYVGGLMPMLGGGGGVNAYVGGGGGGIPMLGG